MGFHVAAVAVKNASLESVLTRVGWSDSGERAAFIETGVYAVALPNGWTVLVGSGWDGMGKVTDELAAHVSHLGETILLSQEDTSMNAMIAAYSGGRERWSVLYDGSTDGISTPVVTGPAPAELPAITARCAAEQAREGGKDADVDHMYEIVLELGLALVGFRPDQDPEGLGPEGFRVVGP
ncbi:MAG: hypothetical protein V4850_04655 [Myxococcota bacterium]